MGLVLGDLAGALVKMTHSDLIWTHVIREQVGVGCILVLTIKIPIHCLLTAKEWTQTSEPG